MVACRRLRRVARHLAAMRTAEEEPVLQTAGPMMERQLLPPPQRIAVPLECTSSAPATLLDDQAVRDFLVRGYTLVRADFGPAEGLHQSIIEQLDTALDRDGNDGVNILPRVPDLQKIYDHPAVRGAVSSLLGPENAMHPNRFTHARAVPTPDAKPQAGGNFHKDSYVYDHQLRQPRPRWLFAMCKRAAQAFSLCTR